MSDGRAGGKERDVRERGNGRVGELACLLAAVALSSGLSRAAPPENAARLLGEPLLEPPTLHSLGVAWIVGGDANRNACVALDYRPAGGGAWKAGMPLFRVERGAHQPERGSGSLRVPEDAWLFAGSLLLLAPGTQYEIRLRLEDPDGGAVEKRLTARTRAEPQVAEGAGRRLHVVPGSGGGSGTAADPFRGLAAAQAAARPGDLFLLHAGRYEGSFHVSHSGEPERPVRWRGAGDGEAVLDAQGAAAAPPDRGIDAVGAHDVWFEDLTVRRARYGIVAHDAARLVVRRCHLHQVEFGLAATRNAGDATRDFFIADNVIEGPSTWPRTKGIEDARGIQVTGAGHDVCYNRVRGFGDAIDTFPSSRCAAIDFHHNEIITMTDDGIEMDYSERNTRCFFNRLTNVFQGISVQPVYGGPVYIYRNVLYNVVVEPFKMHNSPSGALMLHNTCVKKGEPLLLLTPAPVRNSVYRNNLFVGTTGRLAYECDPPMKECDFDYDGFAGGPWQEFLKWNGIHYRTLAEVREKAPVYRHAVQPDAATVFASGLQPPPDEKREYAPIDARLRPGTNAIDAGQPLPGLNDGFAGRAPDLGAFEVGAPPPHYGPRPRERRGADFPRPWAAAPPRR
jgi:hypothetical protein